MTRSCKQQVSESMLLKLDSLRETLTPWTLGVGGDRGDVGAEGAEALRDGGVTPVDRVAGGDHGLALGGQAGQDQGDAGAQVVRHDPGAAELGGAVHDDAGAV